MSVAIRPHMTREEFFDWARSQDGRWEFDGEQPVAMVGGTNDHGKIAGNLYYALRSRLRGGRCIAMLPEGGGIATTGNRVRYPEVTVTCSPVPGQARLIPDPIVVFEVTSPSSAGIDHILKLREYHAVASIRRYVVIEQSGIAATIHARIGAGPWTTTTLVSTGAIEIPELGVTIPLTECYEDVDLRPADTAGA